MTKSENIESVTDTANLNQADMLDNMQLGGAKLLPQDRKFVDGMFDAEDKYPKLFGHLFH